MAPALEVADIFRRYGDARFDGRTPVISGASSGAG